MITTGGVSVGEEDHVRAQVDRLGHLDLWRLAIKPGKPLAFGRVGDTPFFGLPGNPVSSVVCFELFVRPAMVRLAGGSADRLATQGARLTDDHRHRGDRPTYFPARLHFADGQSEVELLAWKGSADLRTLSSADCLAYFPKGERAYRAGDEIEVAVLP